MIYTSYFANLKHLPPNVIPVAICIKAPARYTGLQYKKLAPKYGFFMKWKENHDNDYYRKCFNEQVLSDLNADDVVSELQKMVGDGNDICLTCYENPRDFCHRSLVSIWLIKNGYLCEEYGCGDENQLMIEDKYPKIKFTEQFSSHRNQPTVQDVISAVGDYYTKNGK